MFIAEEITVIKKYDGYLLPKKAQTIMLKFINDNQNTGYVQGSSGGESWIWVFETLDAIGENADDISYLKDTGSTLTPQQLIELRKILLKAKSLGINQISFSISYCIF